MKNLKIFALSSVLFAGAIQADGFGFNIGPFSLQLNAGGDYGYTQQDVLDNPICYAIANQKRLGMIVEVTEKVSTKEMKIITKKIVVEPYAFGVTTDGKPVLRGVVTEDKLLKEVTVRYGEDAFSEDTKGWERKERGYFSGWFKSDKSQNIDIQKLSDVRVIESSHFEAPKDYQGLKEANVKVICQLPIQKV